MHCLVAQTAPGSSRYGDRRNPTLSPPPGLPRAPAQVERALDVARRRASEAGANITFLHQDLVAPLQPPLEVSTVAGPRPAVGLCRSQPFQYPQAAPSPRRQPLLTPQPPAGARVRPREPRTRRSGRSDHPIRPKPTSKPRHPQGRQFDVLLDSCIYHCFDQGPERGAYVANVGRLVKPGAHNWLRTCAASLNLSHAAALHGSRARARAR